MSDKTRSIGSYPHQITLIGFMGCGKTTVGRVLAAMLGMECVDVDRVIEERAGTTISRLFADRGEPYFRDLERAAVAELNAVKRRVVLCSGGGMVLDERNIANVKKNGPVVWLKASPEVIFSRIANEGNRPVLKDGITVENIRDRLGARLALYEKAADLSIDTDGKSAERICAEIAEQLERLSLGSSPQD